MKFIWLFFLLNVCFAVSAQDVPIQDFYKHCDQVLLHASAKGVNYQKLSENSSKLNQLVKQIGQNPLPENPKEEKAYLINCYNVLTLHQVVKHYPITSPKGIPGFFDAKNVILAGKKTSLNDIEKRLFRLDPDPRLHLALVCAAKSCPPLKSTAFRPSSLNEELNKISSSALNYPGYITYSETNNSLILPKIFFWYEADFKPEGGALKFINRYLDYKIPNDAKISYSEYDWSLNDISKPISVGAGEKQSNILTYTPSKLLQKGQIDLKWFNNLYTQTRESNGEGKVSGPIGRSTFYTAFFEGFFGVGAKGKINLGFIATLRSNSSLSNATSVFSFSSANSESRWGLSAIAPAIRYQPVSNWRSFSIQTAVFVPIFKDLPNTFYLDRRSCVIENRVFYDHVFPGEKFQLFSEIDFTFNLGPNAATAGPENNRGERFANNSIAVPISFFLSYFPNAKQTVYVNVQQFSLIEISNNFSQEFTQAGIGYKYQLSDQLNLELSSTYFLRGRGSGLGETYNLGLRYIL